MATDRGPETAEDYARHLRDLRNRREQDKAEEKLQRSKRKRLSADERLHILEKTGSRCHICGGHVDRGWHADHVLAHSAGGGEDMDNYLPAHALCNNYRWDYTSEEFQEILKLGVWARTQIEKQTRVGKEVAKRYMGYERGRRRRRGK